MQQVNLGIIGSGTVGGGVYQAIHRNGALMASRLGVQVRVAKVAVRDVKKVRATAIPPALLTDDWQSVVDDPGVNLVGEFIGGTTTTPSNRANPSSPPTKPSSRSTVTNYLPRQKNTTRISTTKPASPAAFPSSRSCARA